MIDYDKIFKVTHCPYCNSKNIEICDHESTNDSYSEFYHCKKCDCGFSVQLYLDENA